MGYTDSSAAGASTATESVLAGAATPMSVDACAAEPATMPFPNAASESHGAPNTATPVGRDEAIVEQRRAVLQLPTGTARMALALSGGGIRSATYSLGVVQALAVSPLDTQRPVTFKNSMLSRIDYLSTVSGGGYLGGFLCSLFLPGRLRAANRDHENSRSPLKQVVSWMHSKLSSTSNKRDAQVTAMNAPDLSPQHAQANSAKEQQLQAAEDAFRVLSGGPPGRMRADDDFTGEKILTAPLRWLRENGRYLLPTGSGDTFYAMALGLRNWVSLHWVIGSVLVSGLALLMLLRALGATDDAYRNWEMDLLAAATKAYNDKDGGIAARIWWSPLTVLCVAPMASIGLVLGTAFWLVQECEDGRSTPANSSVRGMALVGALLVGMSACLWSKHFWDLFSGALKWPQEQALQGEVLRMVAVSAMGLVALLSTLVYVFVSLLIPSASQQRVALTRWLAYTLKASVVIAGLGIVDTAGQSLYLAAFRPSSTGAVQVATVASPAALAGALAWLVQRVAKGGGGKWPEFVRKLPLMSMAGLAGMLVFVLVGALWAMLAHLMIWGGGTPSPAGLFRDSLQPAILIWMVGTSTAIALVIGLFPGFINQSSLQPFYGSRLTRAYLGASNGRRFLPKNKAKRTAAEPMGGDEIRLGDYVDPASGEIRTLAPIHIINVCVNKTVDPAELLVQRDRKGLPLAVLPCGLGMDSAHISDLPVSSEQKGGQSCQDWFGRLRETSVNRPLTVGQWIGISGAAFSTGIGRETTLGMSLLMGSANIRLGTWWSSGFGRPGTPGTCVGRAMPKWLRELAGIPFRTQRYLSYELLAKFHGTNRNWQYLSDGGHFENTALYELLRPHRRVGTIFASDNGADPEYRFDDLANLIRLARIDLRVRIEIADPPSAGPLAGLFGRLETFRSIALGRNSTATSIASSSSGVEVAKAQEPSEPVAVLLYAWVEESYLSSGPDVRTASKKATQAPSVTQIILIKPLVTNKVPADVRQYAAEHPRFPQEPTVDQFFDEAQWESYRALGEHQASRIFQFDVLQALEEARLAWRQP